MLRRTAASERDRCVDDMLKHRFVPSIPSMAHPARYMKFFGCIFKSDMSFTARQINIITAARAALENIIVILPNPAPSSVLTKIPTEPNKTPAAIGSRFTVFLIINHL